jgi:hypothetical protein
MSKVKEPATVSDYAQWQELCQQKADKHCRRAWNFAGFRGALIVLSALLAAVAAVTSATGVQPWITTTSAGLAAALGVITSGFAPERKNIEHKHLAAGFYRAAREFAFAHERKASPARWTVELTTIVGELKSNTFVDTPERWAAAQVPGP